jgi:hypothetical protein
MQKNLIKSNGNLVAGIHFCTWQDIQEIFAFNEHGEAKGIIAIDL